MNEGFFLEDTGHQEWARDDGLAEIVEKLRGEEGRKLLPFTATLDPADPKNILLINEVSEELMEPGDMILKGAMGDLAAPVEIWWDDEARIGSVDMSCFLDGYLERFAAEQNLSPPVNRTLKNMEVHELSGLGFEAIDLLSNTLHFGDIEDKLSNTLVIYCEVSAVVLEDSLIRLGTTFVGHNTEGKGIQRFVVPHLTSTDLYQLAMQLKSINEQTVPTFDVTIVWNEGSE